MSTFPAAPSQHLYPPALAAEVIDRWAKLDPAGEPLPGAGALEQLFHTLYQASLLTDENRRVRCRVILAAPESWPSCEGPPTGFHVLCFAQPRALEAYELRKLSQAAAYHRGLLGVRVKAGGGLEIWGMINSGARWVSRTDGGRYHGFPLPRNLVAHVTGPGSISVGCGYAALVTAAAPGSALQGVNPFRSRWLPRRFDAMRTKLRERFAAERGEGSELGEDFVRLLAQNVIRRILSLVRDGAHGGMLLFLPDGWLERPDSPVVLEEHLRFAQGNSTRRFESLLLDAMIALSQAARERGLDRAGWSEYQQFSDPQLAVIDEALFEYAHLLADLMSVDGALVLNRRWELLGFGAEVRSRAEVEYVHRALDLEPEPSLPERADRAGTRHRAAYRFAASIPDSLAIVISQDATVRFITQEEGKVVYWDYAP